MRLVAIWAMTWSIAGMMSQSCIKAYSLGNELSDIADAYSEANAIKAGENYAVHGFRSNAGLPDVSYGAQFDHAGGKYDKNLCESPSPCVYLHYPPGPDWIVGAMTKMFGVGNTLSFRVFPLTLGLLALCALAYSLSRTVGLVRAAIVMVALSWVPMTTNMMHGLHYQGNALSLLIIELAILFLAFGDARLKWQRVVGVALVAFVQGWLSFDYCFLVTLAPVPVWLASNDVRARWRAAGIFVLAAGGAFAFAHLCHFAQVSSYLGGVRVALHHMAETAAARSQGSAWPVLPIPGRAGVIAYYWFNLLPDKRYFDMSYLAFVAGALALIGARVPVALRMGGARITRVATPRHALAFVVAIAVCSIWILVMRAHANVHGHFIPRHYWMSYLFGVLLVTRTFSAAPDVSSSSEPDAEAADRG